MGDFAERNSTAFGLSASQNHPGPPVGPTRDRLTCPLPSRPRIRWYRSIPGFSTMRFTPPTHSTSMDSTCCDPASPKCNVVGCCLVRSVLEPSGLGFASSLVSHASPIAGGMCRASSRSFLTRRASACPKCIARVPSKVRRSRAVARSCWPMASKNSTARSTTS